MQMRTNDFKCIITMIGKLTPIEDFWGIADDNKVYYCPNLASGFQNLNTVDVVLKGKLYDVELDSINFAQCKDPAVAFTPPEVSVFRRKKALFKTKMQLVYKGYGLDPSMYRVVSILTNMKDGKDIQASLALQVCDMIDVIASDIDGLK